MAETFPAWKTISDGDAEALEGTTHTRSAIPHIAEDTAGADCLREFMREGKRLRDAVADVMGGYVIGQAGLTIGAFPMRYEIAATHYHFEGATGQAVTASDTNYVYLDTDETLKIVTDAVGWPGTEHRPLAIVVAGAAAITSVTDVRHYNYGKGSSEGWAANAATEDVDVDGNDVVNVDEIELDDAVADASAIGRIRRNGADLTFHDGVAAQDVYHTGKTVAVEDGGTGAAALTDHNVLIGSGTAAVTPIAPGTTGIPLLSQGAAADPAFTAIDLSDTNATTAAALPESRGGTGTVEQYSIPFSTLIYLDGAAAVAVQNPKWFVPANCGCIITKVTAYAVTAPTGAAMIIDVRDDTASIFSDVQGNMCQIAAAANTGSAILGTPHSAAAGSMIDVQIEQVGSGVAGSDVSVCIEGYLEHRA